MAMPAVADRHAIRTTEPAVTAAPRGDRRKREARSASSCRPKAPALRSCARPPRMAMRAPSSRSPPSSPRARSVEQDLAAAATWYERAAGQGFVPAEYRLGNFYETGSGVERDLELARLWYQRAAEAGHRMAMHNLAAIHASGELGAQDFTVAAEWFERAARLGMTDSQFNLGMLYARGLGVEQNFEQSYRWFSIAAARGDQDAGPAGEDIARSLDAAAVARLDAEVAAWSPEPIDLAANFAPIGAWTEDFDPGEAIATTDVVARVQQVLVRLGYDVGTPDGLMGPRTRDAIRAFERGTGMSESGEVNPRLLAVLGSQPV
jgi:localization factor PodJL